MLSDSFQHSGIHLPGNRGGREKVEKTLAKGCEEDLFSEYDTGYSKKVRHTYKQKYSIWKLVTNKCNLEPYHPVQRKKFLLPKKQKKGCETEREEDIPSVNQSINHEFRSWRGRQRRETVEYPPSTSKATDSWSQVGRRTGQHTCTEHEFVWIHRCGNG